MNILALGNCELSPLLGSGKTRLRWSEGLRSRGHRVDTLVPTDFEFWPGLGKGKRFRMAWGACLEVPRRLRAHRYDIVEFFGGEFGWITRRLAARKNRPLVIAHTDGIELLAFHDGAFPAPLLSSPWKPALLSRRLHHQLDHAAFRYADRFVPGSVEDREYAIARGLFSSEHSRTIAPGIDAEFLGRPFNPGKSAHIAYAGTWTERKNPAAIVAVTTAILSKRPETVFHVFGASGAATVIAEAYPSTLRDRVHIHPKLPTEELAQRLGECGVFLFPSLYEGFGMALAEAMGCGCAAVTTPTGFGAELINGEQALVCAKHDVAAMERAVLRLLDDPQTRDRIARAGWERVQALSWEKQVAELESTYLHWLSENRK